MKRNKLLLGLSILCWLLVATGLVCFIMGIIEHIRATILISYVLNIITFIIWGTVFYLDSK